MELSEVCRGPGKRVAGSFSEAVTFVQTAQHIESEKTMIDITVILSAKDISRVADLRTLLAMQVNLSRQEPGCVRFEAFESQTLSGTFILVERWESQTALDIHRTAKGFTTIYAPQVLPLVDRVAHICSVLAGT